ncbi:hypothetical protein C1X87_33810 [Pseudomonas sp. GP01-A14]|nr:hypothetical protein C1X87_33810 [Pseudomonas sp. GP01-A14]
MLWRGSLLRLGCVAAPIPSPQSSGEIAESGFRAATRPSGSKLPRHKGAVSQLNFRMRVELLGLE